MDANHYYTNDEIRELLEQWQQTYPALVNITPIGRSHEDRPIWLVTLTNSASGADTDKPALWLDGNIHATELAGTTTVLLILDTLLAGYGQDPRITRLVDTCTVYAVPRINPDGAAAALAADPRFLRSGVRRYPWEDLQPGLHAQDLDGDGRILQMRIPDPNGDWKISSADPRLMEKRQPDEQGGMYYRVFPEGLLEHYDGFVIPLAPPAQGLDFNRNFPFQWRTEAEQSGAGDFPTSEPEIRAVAEFHARHHNINVALTFHTFARMLLRPYSVKPDEQMTVRDLWLYQKIGQIGTRLTGYPAVSTYHDFRFEPTEMTTGAFDDWVYDHLGEISFTIELWDIAGEAGVVKSKLMEWYREHPVEDDLRILHWVDQHVGPEGYVNWYPYQHPQLGPVELGGWNTLFTWRNPPPALLGQEARRHVPFALAVAEMLPHMEIFDLQVNRLGQDTWALRLMVENSGFLPSFTTQQARDRRAVRPVRAEIKLPEDARLLTGSPLMEIGFLEGRSNKGSMPVWDASPTDNRGKAEWTVSGKEGMQIEIVVSGDRAGRVTRVIKLG